MFLNLCDETCSTVSIRVIAELDPDYFEISGVDTGEAPQHSFGRDEYFYMYFLESENVKRFYNALDRDSNLMEISKMILELFSGVDGCSNFRKFCRDHKIEYTFRCF